MHGLGVTAQISPRTAALQVTLTAARHRFRYVSYMVVGGNRLAVDLWKSAPPSDAAEIRRGPAGCLTPNVSSVNGGLVTTSTRARAIFENQLPLVLRGSDGSVLTQYTVRVTGGRWTRQLTYYATRMQAGTLAAVQTQRLRSRGGGSGTRSRPASQSGETRGAVAKDRSSAAAVSSGDHSLEVYDRESADERTDAIGSNVVGGPFTATRPAGRNARLPRTPA
jgi:hypothetical protein